MSPPLLSVSSLYISLSLSHVLNNVFSNDSDFDIIEEKHYDMCL